MVSESVTVAPTRIRRRAVDVQEVPDYCARPACRRQFTRQLGPGRPQAFCSEVCRRSAEKELRQTRAKLAHLEQLVEQTRIDVAAFNRGATDDEDGGGDLEVRQRAMDAIHRAGGALLFLEDSAHPAAKELRGLHEAVAPVILSS